MNSALNKILFGFLFIILGAVLIPVISDLTNAKTEFAYQSNEVFNIANARIAGGNINESSSASNFSISNQNYTWKQTDCPLTNFVYGNSTADFTVDTDYTINLNTGLLHIKNTTTTVNNKENSTLLDYNYCANDYINSSFGRNVLDLVPGFLAILILVGVGIGLLISGLREWGIIGK